MLGPNLASIQIVKSKSVFFGTLAHCYYRVSPRSTAHARSEVVESNIFSDRILSFKRKGDFSASNAASFEFRPSKASSEPATAVRCSTGRYLRPRSDEDAAQSLYGFLRQCSCRRAFLYVNRVKCLISSLIRLIHCCRGSLSLLPARRPDTAT